MIEINLIPDVKLELLRARRVRSNVISASILVSIIAGGVVALLTFYTFVVQPVGETIADSSIKSESEKLLAIEDLAKTLTVQNQLRVVSAQHDNKQITSRLLSVISTIVPTGKNRVSFTTVELDTKDKVIMLEGEAKNGYLALEALKKTIEQTKFEHTVDGTVQPATPIAVSIDEGDRDYGENSDGARVLHFTISFAYKPELMVASTKSTKIIGPDRQTATDSVVGLPKSLFTDRPVEGEAN